MEGERTCGWSNNEMATGSTEFMKMLRVCVQRNIHSRLINVITTPILL